MLIVLGNSSYKTIAELKILEKILPDWITLKRNTDADKFALCDRWALVLLKVYQIQRFRLTMYKWVWIHIKHPSLNSIPAVVSHFNNPHSRKPEAYFKNFKEQQEKLYSNDLKLVQFCNVGPVTDARNAVGFTLHMSDKNFSFPISLKVKDKLQECVERFRMFHWKSRLIISFILCSEFIRN